MRIEDALREEAEYAAQNAQARLAAVEAELAEIEQQKREKEAQCQSARLAPKRLLEYRLKIGTEYQCPRCWIENERRSNLSAIPSDTRDDIMRCHTCGSDFLIPGGG
jgi:DNA-directed RNA polymerase subunit RPC12/RpoP